ncbi:MAG: SDR family oxidoreductase [Caldilineales bacterium]|nr:SDR family oxidoreductase [Caldilineales bacterium]
MELKGKTAIVTGGSQRIGRALVLALASAGCNITLHYNSSVASAQRTAAEAEALGGRIFLHSANLADPSELAGIVTATNQEFGPAQILINSAAIFPKDTLRDVTLDQWSETFRVNLRAPMLLTQAFARSLPDDMPGAVINLTDWRTARPYADHFSYSVAKGAIDAFTGAAAISLAPQIRVNAIALGAMLPPPGQGEEYLQALASNLPLQRVGGVDVIAQALLYLLGNDFVTGEIVRLDGGAHLQY